MQHSVITTTTTTASASGVRIREARATDTDAFINLVTLIDLRIPTSELPSALAPLRAALGSEPAPPLSHGRLLLLVAEDAYGTPVGAIVCGPPLWIFEHPNIPPFMRGILQRRISTIQMLAVHPNHRGHGIGRNLLHAAEETFTQTRYTVLTLRHLPGLETYYGPLGYTSQPRLAIDLPPLGVITQVNPGWRHAVKPLSNDVALTTRYGHPVRVVTGALTTPPAQTTEA